MTTSSHTADARRQILDTARRIIAGKGFSAVGLNEILAAAGVPKGSFYHYFSSKDAFGEALLEDYFADYHARVDALLESPGRSGAERLLAYWREWLETQAACDPQGKCLAVKLGAEVADLSEAMRAVLDRGTVQIVAGLAKALRAGIADGSLTIGDDPHELAQSLYQMWLGASLLAKISRDAQPLEAALAATRRMLGL